MLSNPNLTLFSLSTILSGCVQSLNIENEDFLFVCKMLFLFIYFILKLLP